MLKTQKFNGNLTIGTGSTYGKLFLDVSQFTSRVSSFTNKNLPGVANGLYNAFQNVNVEGVKVKQM
jgi:hypothetical protein